MTTSAADHAKALRLIQELGATLDQANAVMATEDLTYNDVRFACVCGRFLAESAIRCTDRRDPSTYYGVSTDTEWDCTRCGTVTDQIMPQIVVVGTHTFKAIKPPDEWIEAKP